MVAEPLIKILIYPLSHRQRVIRYHSICVTVLIVLNLVHPIPYWDGWREKWDHCWRDSGEVIDGPYRCGWKYSKGRDFTSQALFGRKSLSRLPITDTKCVCKTPRWTTYSWNSSNHCYLVFILFCVSLNPNGIYCYRNSGGRIKGTELFITGSVGLQFHM